MDNDQDEPPNGPKSYIIEYPLNHPPFLQSLGCEYYTAMKKNKSKIAQYIADTDETDTYQELLTRAIRTALFLRTKNLNKDDIICLCTNNQQNSCVPFIAALFLDIKVASLDPTMALLDTTHLVKQVQPKIFFVAEHAVKLIEQTLEETNLEAEIVVLGHTEDYASFSEYLEYGSDDEVEDFRPEDVDNVHEMAVVFFSSGTTGFPKGICNSHCALALQAMNLSNNGFIHSTSLNYSSLYWISAVLFLSCCILNGHARVICTQFDPHKFWTLIEKFQISFIFLAPSQAIEINKVGRPDNIDTTSLSTLLLGGAAISERQFKIIRDYLPGTFVCQVYGQTEVSGILTLFNVNEVQDTLLSYYKFRSVGRPIPGMSYKVVNVETEEICGPCEQGELRVKSQYYVMNGYYKLDASSSFDSENWLRTGDIVYYDEDHCFFVVDRIKEMLKYKSWHVAPSMLQRVIDTHPAVKYSIVIGIPDELDGDLPMALLILNENHEEVTPQEIIDFVAERVDERQQLRGGVKFIETVPLTTTGKLRKNYLRDLVIQGKI